MASRIIFVFAAACVAGAAAGTFPSVESRLYTAPAVRDVKFSLSDTLGDHTIADCYGHDARG